MSLLKKLNNKATTTEETGFGSNSSFSGGRFYSKDGTPNRVVRGIGLFERFSIYHELLAIKRWKFLLIIFLFFVIINVAFSSIYLLIGIEHLGGVIIGSALHNFGEVFFFSAQTFTTVGYGRINPIGIMTSMVAAIEAMLGLLSFALATGLLYGRFARPQAYLKYSRNALFSPYKNGVAVMVRMAPYKNNHLTEAEVKLTLAMKVTEDGITENKFFNMPVEIAKVNTLTFNWTVVHAINENSPFYNLSKEDLLNASAEILVFVKAFDESFSNIVVSRTSYLATEFVFGAKFKVMYHRSEDDSKTILEMDRLDEFEFMPLPATNPVS